jgi:hypothetical protein
MQEHVTEKLSAYLHHELAQDERQQIAEHLLQCESCRRAHDEIRLGANLAARLAGADAPDWVWREIENALDGKPPAKISAAPVFSFFSPRALTLSAVAVLVCAALTTIVYFGFFRARSTETAADAPTSTPAANPEIARIAPPIEFQANRNTAAPSVSNDSSNAPAASSAVNPGPRALPPAGANPPADKRRETITPPASVLPSWSVETLAGAPRAGNRTIAENGKLSVGQFLETDADSRALVQVADIGEVEIAPNSRVRLVGTRSTEHRLSLERGTLRAKILAAPRLFIVDTPSAVAVDLGCEYTLEVDRDGNSRLHVTSGYVALEKDGRESIVPAGAFCLTRRGKGVGTPFSADASMEFQNALVSFDFQNGGSGALQTIVGEANPDDAVTLWHLLARVRRNDRKKVFDALAAQVPPPPDVTREGILRLDKKMLDRWWGEIENIWFG